METLRRTLALVLAVGACAEPFDASRAYRPSRTLGQEIYNEVCNRVASQAFPHDVSGQHTRATCFQGAPPPSDASPRLFALHAERPRLIAAIDAALSPELATDMGSLLVRMLPLYDDGRVQAPTRALADALEGLASSQASLKALERMGARQGYKPLPVNLGVVRPLFTYPKLDELTARLTRAIEPSGAAHAAFRSVLAATYGELNGMSASGPVMLPSGLREFLLREEPELSDGKRRYLAKRDARGVVEPARAGSAFVTPFIDRNGDGLADIDAAGRLVDAEGRAVTLAPPFAVPGEASSVPRDQFGRLTKSGELVYSYRDASSTVLGGALLEARDVLVDKPRVMLDLVAPLTLVMGRRATRTKVFDDGSRLNFDGFALDDAPVLELAHAGASILNTSSTYWTLRLMEELLAQNEGELAALASAVMELLELARTVYADASLRPNNALFDDLLRLGVEIARVPGLLEDLLRALTDPRTRELGALFAAYMSYKDRIDYNPNDVNGPPVGTLQTGVNRRAADTSDNRSVMQRFLHLIHDCNGARMCNKPGATLDLGFVSYPFFGSYDECELFEINDLAVFYIQSVLGEATIEFKDSVVALASNLDFMLEDLSGIVGFTKSPTPKAINRFVFAPRNDFLKNLVAPPRSADGVELESRHPGTIFAWELYGFFDRMRPLFRAFADHDRLDLLVDIMSVMHLHWSSELTDTTQSYDPNETAYAPQTGIVRLEELAVRALYDYDIMNKLGDLVEVASATQVDGVSGEAVLVSITRQLLLPEWNAGLTTRDGATELLTRGGVVRELAPAHLMLQAVRDLDAALDQDPATRDTFEDAVRRVAEHVFDTTSYGSGRRFANRRGLTLVKMGTTFAREQLYEHWDAGDIDAWAAEVVPDLQEALDHPLTAAALGVAQAVTRDASLRASVEDLALYLLDAQTTQDAFTATLTSLVDVVQLTSDTVNVRPLLKGAAPLFEPEDGALRRGVTLLREAQALDEEAALARLLAGLVTRIGSSTGETPLEAMADIVARLNRVEPSSTDALASDDFAAILGATRSFLLDGERGLERLFELIENR